VLDGTRSTANSRGVTVGKVEWRAMRVACGGESWSSYRERRKASVAAIGALCLIADSAEGVHSARDRLAVWFSSVCFDFRLFFFFIHDLWFLLSRIFASFSFHMFGIICVIFLTFRVGSIPCLFSRSHSNFIFLYKYQSK
jgi:hypothetical protein